MVGIVLLHKQRNHNNKKMSSPSRLDYKNRGGQWVCNCASLFLDTQNWISFKPGTYQKPENLCKSEI